MQLHCSAFLFSLVAGYSTYCTEHLLDSLWRFLLVSFSGLPLNPASLFGSQNDLIRGGGGVKNGWVLYSEVPLYLV